MSGATCSSILWNSPFVDHIRQKDRHKRGGLFAFLTKEEQRDSYSYNAGKQAAT